jgi:hypothetical protein
MKCDNITFGKRVPLPIKSCRDLVVVKRHPGRLAALLEIDIRTALVPPCTSFQTHITY